MAERSEVTVLEFDKAEIDLLNTVFQLAIANLGAEEPALKEAIAELHADLFEGP
jgi:hypothetical protein